MILVFGGTTEGRRVVEVLDEATTPYYYSTRGTGQVIESAQARHIVGGMDDKEITTFCQNHDIKLIIDAAHPFAENLHRNIETAAKELSLPVIRYERKYPELPSDAVVCDDWRDAIRKLSDCPSLLALTGVETIAKLKPYWQTHETWFRILDRPTSWEIVRMEGFPEERILIASLEGGKHSVAAANASAIITKESGESGWFAEKVELARKMGANLFVVRRPTLPPWPTVTGPHGLRRAVEHCLPSFFPLHTGLTTGSCATAAAVAALRCLLGEEPMKAVPIILPEGEEISHPIQEATPGFAVAIKDGGSDPDATHGCRIEVEVEWKRNSADEETIIIEGGEGVGRVTLPGLGIPIGEAAINPVPQQMIRKNLLHYLTDGVTVPPSFDGVQEGLRVTISIPEGRELAKKTFNPRLGIVDGISIIGTSGVVRPFSNEAFVEAIRRQMQIALSLKCPLVVLNSGLKSEKAVRHLFPSLHSSAYIHYGNLIGDALTAAKELGIRHVALCVMIGKAVKLAAGNLNTHSHQVVMDREKLALWLEECGCNEAEVVASQINLARELPQILAPELWTLLKQTITEKCKAICRKVYPYSLDFYLLEP